MAAKIISVDQDLIWKPEDIERLWFFPNGSEHLKYSAHFHLWYKSGFRQNLPLCHTFIVVLEGKLSVKNYYGGTEHRIDVWNQIWRFRGTDMLALYVYAQMVERSNRGRFSRTDPAQIGSV